MGQHRERGTAAAAAVESPRECGRDRPSRASEIGGGQLTSRRGRGEVTSLRAAEVHLRLTPIGRPSRSARVDGRPPSRGARQAADHSLSARRTRTACEHDELQGRRWYASRHACASSFSSRCVHLRACAAVSSRARRLRLPTDFLSALPTNGSAARWWRGCAASMLHHMAEWTMDSIGASGSTIG